MSCSKVKQASDEVADLACHVSPEEEKSAAEFEARMKSEKKAQLQKLKFDSQAIYGLVKGNPGLRRTETWEKLLEEAGDQIGNGHFLVRMLGAERYLDTATVAVLLSLRQNLVAEQPHAGTAEMMLIDQSVVSYFNFFRTQKWIGDLSIVIEGDLFGRDIHNDETVDLVSEQIRRLSEVLIPAQEKTNKMLIRILSELREYRAKPSIRKKIT